MHEACRYLVALFLSGVFGQVIAAAQQPRSEVIPPAHFRYSTNVFRSESCLQLIWQVTEFADRVNFSV